MADPGDKDAVEALEAGTGWRIQPALAVRSEVRRLLASMYGGPVATTPPVDVEIDLNEKPAWRAQQDGWGDDGIVEELHINDLLQRVLDLEGSDLHLTVGIHPSVRVHGELKRLTEFPVLNGSEIRRMVYAILTQKQREKFEAEHELDTSHSIPGQGRFRVNVFLQRDSVGAVLRTIPYEIVPLEKLGLPPAVSQFAQLPRGLVLVTGPTGSGKSTTLASLVDIINSTKPLHIMTVEDPIEFLHNHKVAVVNQREVGEDTHTFAQALKHVLRQDPDVILVGEMRDLETIHTAITAAETGHLVFGTLHTQDAPQSVDRIIDVFPAHQQQQVRVQLASALQGVVTQQLVTTTDGRGRACAAEVLVATPAVRNLIREGKTHQIYSSMQAGGKYGMQTMDQALANLVKGSIISMATALERCANGDDLKRLVGGGI
jgi:twitching motility protein PilT